MIDEVRPEYAEVVYVDGPGEVVLRRESLPADIDRDRIVCKTIVTAISPGTELASFKGLPHLRPEIRYPRLQGYCNVASVLAVGADVTRVAPGDRVLTFISHRTAMCISETEILLVLESDDNPEAIVCAYLYQLGYNAVLRSDVRAGSQVVVLGLGTLGLASTAMAAQAGAVCFAVSDQARASIRAMQVGADACFRREEIAGATGALGPRLADVVIVTTDSWDDWKLALQLCGQRGTIACLGFPGRSGGPIPFNPLESRYFYTKQLRIEAVGFSPESADKRGFLRFDERTNLAHLAQLIRRGRLKTDVLVSGCMRGSDVEQAYRRLAARNEDLVTLLLEWKT